jgi:indoleamine 2,3-dioxygenase
VANHLSLPPTATYAALNLWNFTFTSPSMSSSLCEPENLSALHTFTGAHDEAWFYLISVAMEARGGSIVPIIMRALSAAKAKNSDMITTSLLSFAKCIQQLGALLERMYEKCEPDVFYHQIRPFLAGSKNMAVAGLPRGVFYDEGKGRGEWRQYSGGSNAQSSLIQLFDIVLGIEHRATGEAEKANDGFAKVRKLLASVFAAAYLHPAQDWLVADSSEIANAILHAGPSC